MPNTRSAAKQARASERRRAHNRTLKSRLHTLERKFHELVEDKKATEAAETLRVLTSALDKAVKVQTLKKNLASRKKSRLTARLKAIPAA